MADLRSKENAISLHLEGPPKPKWYHGRLKRAEAEEILQLSGSAGSFIVRESTSKPGVYVLSYLGNRSKTDLSHFRITALCGEFYIGGRQFASLDDLVAYYMNWSDLLAGERLRNPVPPDKEVDDTRYVKAILPYKEKIADTDELEFDKGDMFTVFNELGDGWLWCVNQRTGDSGILYQDLVVDIDGANLEKTDDLEYYHSMITMDEVKDSLLRAGANSYLVRPSDNSPGDHTLFFLTDKTIHKFKIERRGKGFLMGGRFYNRISEIINRYNHEEILSSCTLQVPAVVARENQVKSNNEQPPAKDVYSLMRQSSRVNFLSKHSDVIDGYLYMKKGDKSSKKQKKMFFWLKSSEQQLYYIENPKRSKPDGIIDLNYMSLYPVDESLLGRRGCIQLVSSALDDYQVYYLWSDSQDRIQEWVDALKPFCKNTKPRPYHKRRTSAVRELYSLKISVLEAKNVPTRMASSVYCQLSLNTVPVARTQVKDTPSPLWDELFTLENIPSDVDSFTISMFSKSKRSGTKEQEIFQIKKRLRSFQTGEESDEWLASQATTTSSAISSGQSVTPNIRVKCKYQHEVILPLEDYSTLREVLLSKDLQSVSILGLICDTANDRINLAKALLKIFRHENKEAALLKTLNGLEIANENDVSTLFRGTSLATTLMDQYMKLTAGEFIKSALKETLQKITEQKINIELDPNFVESPTELEANRNTLLQLLNEILQNIFNSVNDCPKMLRHICCCLQKRVSKHWPDNEIVKPRVVSGFIFLRLLCPAIVNPRAFQLVLDSPTAEAQRTMKLVAKSLINLANLVEVGAKEIYMEAIGPFIVDNKQRMVNFLNELSNVIEMPEQETKSISDDEVAREFGIIQDICALHIKNIQKRSVTQLALKKLVAAVQALDSIVSEYT